MSNFIERIREINIFVMESLFLERSEIDLTYPDLQMRIDLRADLAQQIQPRPMWSLEILIMSQNFGPLHENDTCELRYLYDRDLDSPIAILISARRRFDWRIKSDHPLDIKKNIYVATITSAEEIEKMHSKRTLFS